MKITNVEPFAVDAGWIPWVFVKVESDEGITGYGEVSEWRAPRGCIGTVTRDTLVGLHLDENPWDPTRVHSKRFNVGNLHRSSSFQ